MSDSGLPDWLSTARSRARDRRPLEVRDDWPRFPRIGDLRIAEPTAVGKCDPRMVIVIGLEPDVGVADVVLVSNETEFASDVDIVIPAGASGLPFDLLVETELVARLWCVQLGRLVAELGSDLTFPIRQSVIEEKTIADGQRRILKEDAPVDQRALFKEREHTELAALSEDHRRTLDCHEPGSETVVDPALFDPATAGSRRRTFERWLTIAEDLVQTGSAAVPVAALASSLESCGLPPRLSPGGSGPDQVRAVLPLVERVLADRPIVDEMDLEIDPPRSRSSLALDRELMSMLVTASRRGIRTVRLLTEPEAWMDEIHEPLAMARVATADETELQIIRHNLEAGS